MAFYEKVIMSYHDDYINSYIKSAFWIIIIGLLLGTCLIATIDVGMDF